MYPLHVSGSDILAPLLSCEHGLAETKQIVTKCHSVVLLCWSGWKVWASLMMTKARIHRVRPGNVLSISCWAKPAACQRQNGPSVQTKWMQVLSTKYSEINQICGGQRDLQHTKNVCLVEIVKLSSMLVSAAEVGRTLVTCGKRDTVRPCWSGWKVWASLMMTKARIHWVRSGNVLSISCWAKPAACQRQSEPSVQNKVDASTLYQI